MLKSFPQTDVAFQKLLGINLGRKRIERITERIGAERVQQRDIAVDAVAALKLMPKCDPCPEVPSFLLVPHFVVAPPSKREFRLFNI